MLGLLASPVAALAHPLDVFLQATYITVAPAQIVVELDLSPGVLVAPQVLPQLDIDGDQQISDDEGQAYANTMLHNVVLEVDGKPLALTVTKIDVPPYLTIQAGYGTMRIFTAATLADTPTGTHTTYYRNNYAPTGSAYQVNAFVDKGVAVTLGKQNRDNTQQTMTVGYTVGSATTTAATTGTTNPDSAIVAQAASGPVGQVLAYLYEPALSPWVLLLALGLAGTLGDLHALTPGHGKTLAAAYLVGSRGTVRHAVALGSIVTFTHTSSVVVIGVLALFASQFIVPNVLVPVLEVISGLLVVSMGARLVWQRWNAFRNSRNPGYDHDNEHHHDHGQDHTHVHTHDHGDGHTHSHLPPAEGTKFGGLVAMGVSGGLVPCPEALGIMVVAIGLNRILLGLGLIVSFSFGLAAVLIVLGVLLVRSRSLVERLGGTGRMSRRWSRLSQALPLLSAVIVTMLGAGIALSGLAAYLG